MQLERVRPTVLRLTLHAYELAALIAVDLPAGTDDVEEYLVSGVPPASVRHVSDLLPA